MKRSIFKSEAKWLAVVGYGLPLVGIVILGVAFLVRWFTK
jgi:hypothetical protein